MQRTELVEGGSDPRSVSLRPEVLLEFVRSLVANTCSGDVLALALMAARYGAHATEEEIDLLRQAIRTNRSSFMDKFGGKVRDG